MRIALSLSELETTNYDLANEACSMNICASSSFRRSLIEKKRILQDFLIFFVRLACMCGVIVALVYSTENKSISHGLANSVILFLFELCSKLYSLSLSLSLSVVLADVISCKETFKWVSIFYSVWNVRPQLRGDLRPVSLCANNIYSNRSVFCFLS